MIFESGSASAGWGGSKDDDDDGSGLLVFGYACRLFHDDVTARKVNRGETLIPWQGDTSLMIDRYDGRAYLANRADFTPGVPAQQVSWKHPDPEMERLLAEERFGDARTDAVERRLAEEEAKKRAFLPLSQYSEHAPAYTAVPSPPPKPEQPDQGTHGSVLSQLEGKKAKVSSVYGVLAPKAPAKEDDIPAALAANADSEDGAVKTSGESTAAALTADAEQDGHAAEDKIADDTDMNAGADGDAVADREDTTEEQASETGEHHALFAPPDGLKIPPGVETPFYQRLHDIIERTATFVARQGAQMEIMLKAKQSQNTQFQFLDLGHHLYPYYKLLVKNIASGVYRPVAEQKRDTESLGPSIKGSVANQEFRPIIVQAKPAGSPMSIGSQVPGGDRATGDDSSGSSSSEEEGFSGLHPSLFAASRRTAGTAPTQTANASTPSAKAPPKPPTQLTPSGGKPAPTSPSPSFPNTPKRLPPPSASATKRKNSSEFDDVATATTTNDGKDGHQPASKKKAITAKDLVAMRLAAAVRPVSRPAVKMVPIPTATVGEATRNTSTALSSSVVVSSLTAAVPSPAADATTTVVQRSRSESPTLDGDAKTPDDGSWRDDELDGDGMEEWPTREMLAAVEQEQGHEQEELADRAAEAALSYTTAHTSDSDARMSTTEAITAAAVSGPGDSDMYSTTAAAVAYTSTGYDGQPGYALAPPDAAGHHQQQQQQQQYANYLYYCQQHGIDPSSLTAAGAAAGAGAGNPPASYYPQMDPYSLANHQAHSLPNGVAGTSASGQLLPAPHPAYPQQSVVDVQLPFVPPPPPEEDSPPATPDIPDDCPESPANDLKIVVDKLAEYVARNGRDFEQCVLAKGDPKFSFLEHGNPLFVYYAWQRREQERELVRQAEKPEAAAVPLTSSKTSTTLGTVSFKLFKKAGTSSTTLQPGVQFSDDDEEEDEDREAMLPEGRDEAMVEDVRRDQGGGVPAEAAPRQHPAFSMGAYSGYVGPGEAASNTPGAAAPAMIAGVLQQSSGIVMNPWMTQSWQGTGDAGEPQLAPAQQQQQQQQQQQHVQGEQSQQGGADDVQAERRRRALAFKQRMMQQQQQQQQVMVEQQQTTIADQQHARQAPPSSESSTGNWCTVREASPSVPDPSQPSDADRYSPTKELEESDDDDDDGADAGIGLRHQSVNQVQSDSAAALPPRSNDTGHIRTVPWQPSGPPVDQRQAAALAPTLPPPTRGPAGPPPRMGLGGQLAPRPGFLPPPGHQQGPPPQHPGFRPLGAPPPAFPPMGFPLRGPPPPGPGLNGPPPRPHPNTQVNANVNPPWSHGSAPMMPNHPGSLPPTSGSASGGPMAPGLPQQLAPPPSLFNSSQIGALPFASASSSSSITSPSSSAVTTAAHTVSVPATAATATPTSPQPATIRRPPQICAAPVRYDKKEKDS